MRKSLKIRVITTANAKGLKRVARFAVSKTPAKALSKLSRDVVYELSVSLVGPEKMKRLNRQYRHKNRPTDVLAFSALEGRGPRVPVQSIGDVVVCLAVAKKQAKDYGSSLAQELRRLTVHGVLHLFGYDHEKSPKEAKRMFALQEKILKQF